MIPQRIKQSTGKTKVTLHELFRMLRTVDTRKVENKISLSTEVVEFFLGISEIILKDFIHLYAFVPTGFAPFMLLSWEQRFLPTKPLAPVTNIFIIYLARFITPLSSFWMYSRAAILALVSSRSRRRVLSELNSVSSQRF